MAFSIHDLKYENIVSAVIIKSYSSDINRLVFFFELIKLQSLTYFSSNEAILY